MHIESSDERFIIRAWSQRLSSSMSYVETTSCISSGVSCDSAYQQGAIENAGLENTGT